MRKQIILACLAWLITCMQAPAQEWLKAASLSASPKLPTGAFAQLGRFTGPEISPDGKRIAYLSSLNGRNNVVIRPLDPALGATVAIPPSLATYEFRWLGWANNERVLVGLGTEWRRGSDGLVDFTKRTRETRMISVHYDGKDAVNMYKPAKKLGTGTRLGIVSTSNFAVVQDDVIHWTPDDPDTILLSTNDDYTSESGAVVRKINVTNGNYDVVATGRPGVWRYETDLSADVRLGWGKVVSGGVLKDFFYYKSPEDKVWQKIENSLLFDKDTRFIGFMADSRFAYVLMPVDGRRSLVKFDMRSQSVAETIFRDPQSDIERSFRNEKKEIVGVRLARDQNPDVFFDPAWNARVNGLKRALKGYDTSLQSISDDGNFIILRATSAAEPGLYYLYNISGKTLEQLAYDYAGLGPENAAYRQSVRITARDGLEMEAFLTLPRGLTPKNLPTVILPHGGPWARDNINYDWWSQFLANRGYAVLQPNFRGSTGYGQAFLDKGNGQWGLAMQDDITDSAEWMVKNNIADKKRICIVGGSYGGYAAMMAAVKTPDLFRCASSLNGVSDILQLLGDDNGRFKDEQSARLIGDRTVDRDRLKTTSPINGVDKIKIPVQLVHARDDLRVDIKQSQRMRDRLTAAGKSVDYVEIANGEHWLENEQARLVYLTALEKFLAKNIGQ